MYLVAKILCGVLIIALGCFMNFFPNKATKNGADASEENIKKVKRNGKIVIVCGIIVTITNILIETVLK